MTLSCSSGRGNCNWPCLAVSFLCFAVLVFNFLTSCFILHVGQTGILSAGESAALFGGRLRAVELSASSIRSLDGDLHLSGDRGVFIHGRASSSQVLQLGKTLTARTKRFSVVTKDGETTFAAEDDAIATSARSLRLLRRGAKVAFEGGIRAKTIDSFALEGLDVRSSISSVSLTARESVALKSASGDIALQNARNVSLSAAEGIHLKAKRLYLKGVFDGDAKMTPALAVCLCADGSVFFASGSCREMGRNRCPNLTTENDDY